MKIINFNIERLLILSKLKPLIELIKSYNADIVVLTETNSKLIDLGEDYFAQHSKPLSKNQDNVNFYRDGENRVSIYSKYRIIRSILTTDEFTSLAVELDTNFGELIVYGTIVGIFGYSRDKERFVKDFNEQKSDFKKIFPNENVCLVGDLNMSLSGWIYPSKEYRENLNDIINQYDLDSSTGNIKDNIDHILISNEFIKSREIQIKQFNLDKKLSDHIGIFLTIVD